MEFERGRELIVVGKESQTSNTLVSDLMDVYTQFFSLVPLMIKYMSDTDSVQALIFVWLMGFVLMTAMLEYCGESTCDKGEVLGILGNA